MGGLKVTSTSERKCCRCLLKLTDGQKLAIQNCLHICDGTGENGYGEIGIVTISGENIRDESRD